MAAETELRIVLRAVGTELLQGMRDAQASVDRATAAMQQDFARLQSTVITSTTGLNTDRKSVV